MITLSPTVRGIGLPPAANQPGPVAAWRPVADSATSIQEDSMDSTTARPRFGGLDLLRWIGKYKLLISAGLVIWILRK